MANYIEVATLRYPVSQSQIKAENPNTSYPASFPCPEGFAVVFPAPAPTYNPITQYVREIAPVLTIKGTYEQAFEVLDLTQEQIDANIAAATANFISQVTTATQQRLDEFAKTRNYDGILSACTYASDIDPKFAKEGQYAVVKRSETWQKLYQIMEAVKAGTRTMPTLDEIILELPTLTWPA